MSYRKANLTKDCFINTKDGEPLPSAKVLYEIIELSRSILFPGYYGNSTINSRTINYHIGVNIEKLFDLLTEQILAGLCFGTSIEGRCNACSDSKERRSSPPCRQVYQQIACHAQSAGYRRRSRPITATLPPKVMAKLFSAIPLSRPSVTTASRMSYWNWVSP